MAEEIMRILIATLHDTINHRLIHADAVVPHTDEETCSR